MPEGLQTRKVDTHPVFRTAEIEGVTRKRMDEDDENSDEIIRLELSFSSEYEVERYDYWDGGYFMEVLDHDPSSVRLERINGGSPFLMDHRHDRQIGVIEKAWIKDKRGFAEIRLSKNARDYPNYGDLVADFEDGIRKQVSVGYRVYKAVLAEENDNAPNVYRMTDWEPFEISSVSVPADPTVGLDRAAMETRGSYKPNPLVIEGTRAMPPVEQENPNPNGGGEMSAAIAEGIRKFHAENPGAATPGNDSPSIAERAAQVKENAPSRDEIVGAERARQTQIEEAAVMVRRIPGIDESELANMVRDFKASDKEAAEFFSEAVSRLAPKAPTSADGNGDLGMSKKERSQYSLFRAVDLMDKVKQGKAGAKDYSRAGFEIEISQEVEAKRGNDRPAQGLLVPDDILRARTIPAGHLSPGMVRAITATRDLTVGAGTADALVQTTVDMVSFIDLLRASMVLRRLGTRVLDGLTGNLAIPRQTGGATVYWVGESGNITESTPAFDQVTLTPHTLGAMVDISRRTLIQPDMGVAEALVLADMAMNIAIELDRAGINGAPAVSATENEPLGILNLSGIGSVTAAGLTRDLLVDLEGEVAVDNALLGDLGYLTNTKVRSALKKARVDTGSGVFVWPSNESQLEGYNVEVTTQVPSTLGTGSKSAMIFGNFADQILGMWTGLDINVDTSTLSASGGLRLVALQDVDYAYRHPESFAAAIDLDAG